MTIADEIADFEKVVARVCLAAATRHIELQPFIRGDESAVRYGAHLIDIQIATGLSQSQTRRRLKHLHGQGRLLRHDTDGGCTRWWLVGLAPRQDARQPPASAAMTPSRQTLTNQPAHTAREHWSVVLGVDRDCSTSVARPAIDAALDALADLHESTPGYASHRLRVREAINECCIEHGIQINRGAP